MKNVYWGVVGLLGFIHLIHLLGDWVSFYVLVLAVVGVVFYLARTVGVSISYIGWKWNALLAVMQGLLLLFYLVELPVWLHSVGLVLFVGIEVVRLVGAERGARLTRTVQQQEEQLANLNETFRIVRSERHDFLKHVSALHFMLEHDRADEAKRYLDYMVGSYEETNFSIKGERGSVASVLHQAYQRGKASGVELVYDLDIPLSTIPISDQDMVALIGNLLSNALEACEEWQRDRKQQAVLTVQMYKRSGLYLLSCKNDSLPIPTPILDELFTSYGKTTKGGAHEGLGTKIIKDIVEKYHGFLDFVHKKEEFEVKIKIPAIK